MTKYTIIWTRRGSLVHEESLYASSLKEAVKCIPSRSEKLYERGFDEVKLVINFEESE